MDTIVMANLGYLQLKSSPGRWLLKLRQGRSDELYDIVSIDGKTLDFILLERFRYDEKSNIDPF